LSWNKEVVGSDNLPQRLTQATRYDQHIRRIAPN